LTIIGCISNNHQEDVEIKNNLLTAKTLDNLSFDTKFTLNKREGLD
jgi:hypothetical protein